MFRFNFNPGMHQDHQARYDIGTCPGTHFVPRRRWCGIGSPQLTVGLIKGGINTNVVPDRVTFRLDRRRKPEERSAEVEAELVTVIAGAATAYPEAQVTVRRILVVEPLTPIPVGQRLTGLLCQNATRIMGEKVGTEGVPLYTDAWH